MKKFWISSLVILVTIMGFCFGVYYGQSSVKPIVRIQTVERLLEVPSEIRIV